MATAKMADHERAWELFSLVNPISHSSTPEAIAKYRVEPYVVAADVYGIKPHTGRGGWTWYTGSAGWMYRLILESLLGLRLEADRLYLAPCFPAKWDSFKIHYRYRNTFYHISVKSGGATATVNRLTVDGLPSSDDFITLLDDGRDHVIEVEIATPKA
jgi:cellobiose phosphorylase